MKPEMKKLIIATLPCLLFVYLFGKLDSSHIEFVFDCISKNTTEIRNIKKYLLAVLFNAPSTINGYYTALVAHDMNTGSWGTPQNR